MKKAIRISRANRLLIEATCDRNIQNYPELDGEIFIIEHNLVKNTIERIAIEAARFRQEYVFVGGEVVGEFVEVVEKPTDAIRIARDGNTREESGSFDMTDWQRFMFQEYMKGYRFAGPRH